MRLKRIISVILCIVLIASFVPQGIFAQNNGEDKKTTRNVYVHSFDEPVSLQSSTDVKNIKRGDTANIYVAVDDPNMAEDDSEYENQFNLGGFTVKIYYDTKFFELEKESTTPIEYEFVSEWSDSSVEGGEVPDDFSEQVGYMMYAHGTHTKDGFGTQRLGYAYATIFYKGGILPETKETDGKWYNILKLPLKAKENGYTTVYIDTSGSDEYTFELFAKNIPNSDYDGDGFDDIEKNFKYKAVNNGEFHFNISDSTKPMPPVANPASGEYTSTQFVKLSAEADCKIYFTTDDNATKEQFEQYTDTAYPNGIEIPFSQNIRCYALREKDGKESYIETYFYKIIPKAPELFNNVSDENPVAFFIPPVYYEYWKQDSAGYYVNASNTGDISQPVNVASFIYYTFTNLNSDLINDQQDNKYVGTDPYSQWVRVTSNTGSIPHVIDKKISVRLVAVNTSGKSSVAIYHLGVKPGNVTANPQSGMINQGSVDVQLECKNPEAAEIYYTVNDGDPRTHGVLYTGTIPVSYDTTIRAVAKYNGEWGDVSAFWYQFDKDISAFYPPGEYVGSVNVVLTPKNPENIIEYQIDGGKWSDYEKGVISLKKDTAIRARIKGDSSDGELFEYKIKPYPPVFEPSATQFTSSEWVTVFAPESTADTTDDYSIRYTTDGTDPITSPTANTASNATYDDKLDEVRVYVTDYTEIKAVVVKDGIYYSDVVTNVYEVVHDRPATPVTVLEPGYYTFDVDDKKLDTLFDNVPDNVDVYYTVSYDGGYVPDPEPGEAGNGVTYKYDKTKPIEVKGHTVIKAIAVKLIDGVSTKSNVGVYIYTVTPEAPTALKSGDIQKNILIPVQSVSGDNCYIEYEINENTTRFANNNYREFYIDTKTGNVYADNSTESELIHKAGWDISSPVNLKIKAILDNVTSIENGYVYKINQYAPLDKPFADKNSGMYTENKNGFSVNLGSDYPDNKDISIEWTTDGKNWSIYNNTLTFPTEDIVLNIRVVDDKTGQKSDIATYVYYFEPPVPDISLPSGVYTSGANLETVISKSDALPDNQYRLYFQISQQGQAYSSFDVTIPVNNSMSVQAFIKNEDTNRISRTVSAYYILRDKLMSDGSVIIEYPYSKDKISGHRLGKGDYAKGIVLTRTGTGIIKYQYRYKLVDSDEWTNWTDVITYDPINPVIPTSIMDELEITAWIDGDRDNTKINHTIDFIHLGVPNVRLDEQMDSNGNYPQGTNYYVQNKHSFRPEISVYYTIDGKEPSDINSITRTVFSSEESKKETLSGVTTVKAAYYEACMDDKCSHCSKGEYSKCVDGEFGDTVTYIYTVPTKVSGGSSSGGGGGTRVVDKTRKYTKDIFGNEHPTHIGYINGYPDGSVKPDGDITREEMTAILYRITNHEYEKPFAASGDAFPDVEAGRWSAHDIEYMADKKIVYGYSDGEFKPSRNLTRAEFAALIFRFVDVEKTDVENIFTDIDHTHWAYDEVIALANSGLIEGYPDKTYKPENNITRAEVMTVINKLLGRKPLESYVKSLGFNPYIDLYIDKWYYVTVLEATITHNYWLDDSGYEHKWEDWK